MTGRHRSPNWAGSPHTTKPRQIGSLRFQTVDRCSWYAQGFCAAAVDGYCLGGYISPGDPNPRCHG